MSDDGSSWETALQLRPGQAAQFARLATYLNTTPPEILKAMVERVLEFNRDLGSQGLGALKKWAASGDIVEGMVDCAVHALPVDIRPSSFMWPPNKALPWTDRECRAAVIGYQVRWRASADDLVRHLRGSWELVDGYAVLRLV